MQGYEQRFQTYTGGTFNDKVIISNSGNVGIGTTAPVGLFHTSATSDTDLATRWVGDSYSSAGGGQHSGFVGRRARGTAASPTAVQTDDTLLSITARGYGATAFSTSARGYLSMTAAENWTDSAQGTKLAFGVTPTGSATSAVAMTILGNGNINLPIDSQLLQFGAGQDATISYDGTNMIINPKLVGTGYLSILGDIRPAGYQSSDGTAGLTATKVFNDGAVVNTVTIKNGLITAWTQV
jgi:hypothetical protein